MICLCVEAFIVWMRTAGLPTFSKLYGRFEDGLEAGDYEMKIGNNYPVTVSDEEESEEDAANRCLKSFILMTVSSLGGNNLLLAWSYLVIGFLCLAFGIIFCVFNQLPPLIDHEELGKGGKSPQDYGPWYQATKHA